MNDLSTEERKTLYRALRSIADLTDTHIEVLIIRAVGQDIVFGTDYISNFRRGNIAQARARKIHAWLAQNHWADVHEVEPELFPAPKTGAWETLIENRASVSGLSVMRLDQFGIVQRVRDGADDIATLKLGTPFCFEITSQFEGQAIMLQEHRDEWYLVPLPADGKGLRGCVFKDNNTLPRSVDGKPIPLTENDDTGRHQFVCLVVRGGIKLKALKELEKRQGQFVGPVPPAMLNTLADEIAASNAEDVSLLKKALRYVA